MKKYLLILLLLLFSGKGFSQLANAQPQATTANYYKAEFSGGDETFQKEFMNMVHAHIDMALYAVQGKATFIFNIDPKGRINNIDGIPVDYGFKLPLNFGPM